MRNFTTNMLLKNLINSSSKKINKITVNDLSLDSRKVKKNSLFFALQGTKVNGEKFIEEAILNGASAIVCSKRCKFKNYKIPTIKVANPKKYLADICIKFFKKKPKNIIAVTGTNGKSSVAEFFRQIFYLNKIPVASIGTLGIKENNKTKKLSLTSPDIISLHKKLEKLKNNKIDNVILEASSHGLSQGRLDGIDFKAGIFTNFSQDHLDYHKTMKNYFNSKMILFSKLLKKNRVVITDNSSKYYKKLKKLSVKKNFKILTINKNLVSSYDKKTNLIGLFQIKNLCMSILAAKLCGLSLVKIDKILKNIQSVDGRLELVKKFPNNVNIFIDYAHTPDALLTATSSLKKHFKNKLSLVFGCGGERDVLKRALMAKVALKYCDKIYVTDDNPRNENPKKIRKDIIKYLKTEKKEYFNIGNRSKAINQAVKNTLYNETILIAGKGHEDYQDYGKKILKISDRKIVKKISIKKTKIRLNKINQLYNSILIKDLLNRRKDYKFEGISINSKEIKKHNLFLAIKGKHRDGHDFVEEAIKNGAKYCVVSKKIKKFNKKRFIEVHNTTKFLEELGIAKRKLSKAKIIAVTGSSGKTTVKTILGNILNNFGKTYFSPKSYNNHYGVPLSLANLENNHKYGVFEVGMSRSGEIKKLSKMVRPDVGIITNIGEAHIENFRNTEEIAKAKSEIIENIKKDGTVILNRDDKFFTYLYTIAKKNNINILSYGLSKQADIHLLKKSKNNSKIKVNNKILNFNTKGASSLNLTNLLCSLTVLESLNLNHSNIKNFLKYFISLSGRGQMHRIKRFNNTFNLIDESYNANPYSVKNAINHLSKIKVKDCKKYLLLGDMLELGIKSDGYHYDLSKFINKADIDKVFVYGDKVLNTFKKTKKIKRGNILQHKSDFDDIFSNIIKKNDYLMIKGSNATGLNILTNKLIRGEKNVI